VGVEDLARPAVDLAAGDAGLDRLHRPPERLEDQPVILGELLGRVADDVRARHVGVASRPSVPRPDVDDDRLAGRNRPGAHLVADGALRPVRDDELVGGHVALREDLADPPLELLARQRLAADDEHRAVRPRLPE